MGNIRVLQAVTAGAAFVRAKNDTTTIITQTLIAVTKPCQAKLKDEFLVCQRFKFSMTSAQTAPKTVWVFAKGG